MQYRTDTLSNALKIEDFFMTPFRDQSKRPAVIRAQLEANTTPVRLVLRRTKTGSSRKRRKMQKAAKTEKFLSKAEKKLIVHKYLGKVTIHVRNPTSGVAVMIKRAMLCVE